MKIYDIYLINELSNYQLDSTQEKFFNFKKSILELNLNHIDLYFDIENFYMYSFGSDGISNHIDYDFTFENKVNKNSLLIFHYIENNKPYIKFWKDFFPKKFNPLILKEFLSNYSILQ